MATESQKAINQREYDRMEDWRWGGYASKLDTRIWVPKRLGNGFTLNFAWPGARWALAAPFIPATGLLLVWAIVHFAK